MKTSITLLSLLIWLGLNGQSNKRIPDPQPVLGHEQIVKLLLKENVPYANVLKNSLITSPVQVSLRSVSAVKQKLDSIVSTLKKDHYTYNAKENLTLYINIARESITDPWINNTKEENSYNANGYPLSNINSKWDTEGNKWENVDKTDYGYDASGRMISITSYDWDKTLQEWAGSTKSEYTYDSNGNMTVYTGYSWDTALKNWVNSVKYESTFNAQKKTTVTVISNWDKTNNQWVNKNKIEYSYNAAGYTSSSSMSNWEIGNNQWVYFTKTEYTYNANNQYTVTIDSKWETPSGWVYLNKTEYGYDAQGYETSYSQFTWDTVSGTWTNKTKYEWAYDSSHNTTLSVYSNWFNNAWMIVLKSEYNYNASSQLTIQTDYNTWFDALNDFMNKTRTDYSYDGSGNVIFVKESTWSIMTPVWTDKSKEDRTYENSFSYADLVLPHTGIAYSYDFSLDYSSEMFNHMLKKVILSDYNGGAWTVSNNSDLYYSALNTTGTAPSNTSKVVIYPNPASDFISVTIDNHFTDIILDMFDLSGKLVIHQTITNQWIVSTGQLASGIYMVRIKSGDELIHTEKVVIK